MDLLYIRATDLYTNPTVDNSVASVYGALWAFQALATISFFLRMISRTFFTRDVGWEDVFMATGWASNLAGGILLSTSISTGEKSYDGDSNSLKLALIARALITSAMWLPKIAVALLLMRLLQPSLLMKFVLIVPSIIGTMIAYPLSSIILFVQCNPVQGQWDPEHYQYTCWPSYIVVDVIIAVAAYSTLVEILYAIYPITVFWKLKLALRTRIGISILMGLGIISGALGIYKLTIIPLLGETNGTLSSRLAVTQAVVMWCSIETDFIIIAACVPMTRPIFRLLGKHASDTLRSTGVKMGFKSYTDDDYDNYTDNDDRQSGTARRKYIELTGKSSRSASLPVNKQHIHIENDLEINYSQRADLENVSQMPKGSIS